MNQLFKKWFYKTLNFLIITLSVIVLFSAIFNVLIGEVGLFDESIQLVNAVQIQNGLVPHGDFFSFYPPLNYLINSLSFSIIGKTVLATRLVQIVFYLIFIGFLFCFFTKEINNKTRKYFYMLVALIVTGTCFSLPYWNALVISFITIITYLIGYKSAKRHIWRLVTGLFLGILLLFKINFSLYLVAGITISLILEKIPKLVHNTGKLVFRDLIIDLSALLLPVLSAVIIYIFWVDFKILAIIDQTFFIVPQNMQHRLINFNFSKWSYDYYVAIIFPLLWMSFKLNNSKKYLRALIVLAVSVIPVILATTTKYSLKLAYLLPCLLVLIVIFLNFFFYRLRKEELILLICYSFFLNYFLTRADLFHYFVILPFIFILLPFILAKNKSGYLIFIVIILIIFIPAVKSKYLGCLRYKKVSDLKTLVINSNKYEFGKNKSLWQRAGLYPDQDELRAVTYLQRNVGQEAKIYVGTQEHAKGLINDMRFYWLAGRPIGTKYYELEPGITTEDSIQKKIIQDLNRNKVKWIVLFEGVYPDSDFRERNYHGSLRLDRYIRDNFKNVKTFGRYQVLVRNYIKVNRI